VEKPSYLSWLRKTAKRGYRYDARHFIEIAKFVDRVIAGEITRGRIHMPPRHGKTETVTKALVIWFIKNRPGSRILVTGHNQRFARKLSREIRNSAIAQGVILAKDKSGADEWETEPTSDGTVTTVLARGVGSVPTGEGFDLIIVDDPTKDRKQADSFVFRESLWDWFSEGLMTRVQPNGIVICIWTLWHEDDIAGRMDALADDNPDAEQWEKLVLKAIAEEGDLLGRKVGAALWPEGGWTLAALNKRRLGMDARSFRALYQQDPRPREGSIIKISRLNYCEAHEVPKGLRKCRGWDLAFSADGDATAGARLEGPDKNGMYYLTDMVHARLSTGARNSLIRSTAEMDGKEVTQMIPQDPGSAGGDVATLMVQLLAGFPVKTEKVTGKKAVRAQPFATQVEHGNVTIVRAPWTRDCVEELRTFDVNEKGDSIAAHDDRVDAIADAFNQIALPGGWMSQLGDFKAMLKDRQGVSGL